MRRAPIILLALTLLTSLVVLASSGTAEPAAEKKDPWVGTFLQYGRYDSHRQGQFGEARSITISKHESGYRLSAPYDSWTFTEVEKGVLSGEIGKIYLGSAEFANGKRVPVLRADFCYEWFILYGDRR
jgi:hypothetical protein